MMPWPASSCNAKNGMLILRVEDRAWNAAALLILLVWLIDQKPSGLTLKNGLVALNWCAWFAVVCAVISSIVLLVWLARVVTITESQLVVRRYLGPFLISTLFVMELGLIEDIWPFTIEVARRGAFRYRTYVAIRQQDDRIANIDNLTADCADTLIRFVRLRIGNTGAQ